MNINQKYIDEMSKLLNPDEIKKFLEACHSPLKKSIRINTHKISSKDFINTVKPRGWSLTKPDFLDENKESDTYYIDRENLEIPLGNTFLHQAGFFYIQEVAASMPAQFLDIKTDDLVLDISAAPGGKTVQIGDYLLKAGTKPGLIIANDVSAKRNLALSHNISRMGIYNSVITSFNGFAFGKNLGEIFDKILIDAPCSGEGTGFKSDFALKYWKKEEINKICGTQFQLLVSGVKSLKPGGTLIYSTCTLNPYENELNIAKLLDFWQGQIELQEIIIPGKSQGFEQIGDEQLLDSKNANKVARFWPHIQHTGGFFLAKFVKKEPNIKESNPAINKLAPKNQFKIDISNALQKKVSKWMDENYGIKINPDQHLFVATKNKLYLCTPKVQEIKDKIQMDRLGIPVMKIYDNGIMRPTHNMGTILGHLATKNFVELDEQQAQEYSQTQDINLDHIKTKELSKMSEYVVIKRKNRGISTGKIINNEYIKNKFFK